ncbi:hypothetical protein [Aureimonas sp. ME7]|uniref:hypothetical protein n=1 Tax=Aureimonas sp. ME7 TaxID=2744252 RepID=UPI0015F5D08B|nr:hypothetical protein [Aureimonas sp. ME7]
MTATIHIHPRFLIRTTSEPAPYPAAFGSAAGCAFHLGAAKASLAERKASEAQPRAGETLIRLDAHRTRPSGGARSIKRG